MIQLVNNMRRRVWATALGNAVAMYDVRFTMWGIRALTRGVCEAVAWRNFGNNAKGWLERTKAPSGALVRRP